MIAQSQNQPVATSTRNKTERPTPWQWQLLKTDFRHALWPWLGYVGAMLVLMIDLDRSDLSVTALLITILLILPAAIVVQVICSDFSHGTMPALLCVPVKRTRILLCRYGLIGALVLVPPVCLTLLLGWDRQIGLPLLRSFLLPVLAMAVPLAMFFKKKHVAWTGIVATCIFAFFCAPVLENILNNLFHSAETQAATWNRFAELFFKVYFVGVAVVSTALSFWYWKRMEVRQ